MAAVWGTPFVEAGSCNNSQLLLITIFYSIVLYQASNLISDGSEYLLLIPSVAGLVGSIVLPILGAVPDGMMTLMSGMGPDAQNQISVGVGVLAGSTIMLLTFPWFIAIIYGKVPLDDKGVPQYNLAPELKEKAPFCNSGISFSDSIPKNGKIMVLTTFLFLIIQLPATEEEEKGASIDEMGAAENPWALCGLIASVAFFFFYLGYCYFDANSDKQVDAIIEGIKKRTISLPAALKFVDDAMSEHSLNEELIKKDEAKLKQILKPFFNFYDFEEPRGTVDDKEFVFCCKDLGLDEVKGAELFEQTKQKHKDGDVVTFEGFVKCMKRFLSMSGESQLSKIISQASPVIADVGDDDDEEEVTPDDLADLPVHVQKRRIVFRAVWMMLAGTLLVLFFSDPFVEVLSEWGTRLNVPGFYVSFVVAPFASNASELIAAYNYAVKKTQKSITTSLSTLIGAACMNNTFCLAIFLALIWYKSLAWEFTAETISIMVSQWFIGFLCITKPVHTTITAFVILSVYPLSIVAVYVMKNVFGLD